MADSNHRWPFIRFGAPGGRALPILNRFVLNALAAAVIPTVAIAAMENILAADGVGAEDATYFCSGKFPEGPRGPSLIAICNTCAVCRACRLLTWRICSRQLKPSAMMSVSFAALRTLGRSMRSPHATETS